MLTLEALECREQAAEAVKIFQSGVIIDSGA